ncbi:hypothetical protein PIB30_101391 [Stylosanthes scabra]|uniref:Uncharacterized protein n=1 Tax=Stylosanthes scabra TaxID=79078 RepID=A0ABU6UYK2_9FABA|nr:hypothetical protein [Stylosanthes scabra]
MIGAGKNGPPGKYERWLFSASSGSVGLAMITDRVWRSFRTENPWVGDSHSVYSSDFSERFFPYEPDGSNYCIIMYSLNQVNRVRSLAYGNDVS